MTERIIHQTRGLTVGEDEKGLYVSVVMHVSSGCEYTDGGSQLSTAGAVAFLHKHASRLRMRAEELEDVASRLLREHSKP